jgi:hypothetical protein
MFDVGRSQWYIITAVDWVEVAVEDIWANWTKKQSVIKIVWGGPTRFAGQDTGEADSNTDEYSESESGGGGTSVLGEK